MSKQKRKVENGISLTGMRKDSKFWGSIVLLTIMVLSIGGFALSGSGGNSNGDGQLPSEVPFQQFEDPNTGTPFWGAIRNNEQFIFMDIVGYDNRTDLANLAGAIKAQNNVEIYADSTFNSAESMYILDKTFRGIQIPTTKVLNETCNANTLVLTLNNTLEGDCMIFETSLGNEYRDMENLVYFLIQ